MTKTVHSRDKCAYKKEGGNTEDTYCFRTEGATHSTECVATGETGGYLINFPHDSLSKKISFFPVPCLNLNLFFLGNIYQFSPYINPWENLISCFAEYLIFFNFLKNG